MFRRRDPSFHGGPVRVDEESELHSPKAVLRSRTRLRRSIYTGNLLAVVFLDREHSGCRGGENPRWDGHTPVMGATAAIVMEGDVWIN